MKKFILIITTLMLTTGIAWSQEAAEATQPQPLFDYPQAPDTCSTLESRCNYIITHFWDNYNFSRPISDEAAFEVTFRDYVDFFRYAHRNVVKASIRDFVNKCQANASNLTRVADVAERSLYGKDAEYWSDEVYVEFAKSLAASKQLPGERRKHLADQLQRMNANQVGGVMDFVYTDINGASHRLSELAAKSFILLFVDDGSDSSIARVRLGTDVSLNALLDAGEACLVCVSLCKYTSQWAASAAGFNSNWTVVCSEQLAGTIDLRAIPSCYVLDGERKIMTKQLSIEALKSSVNPR